MNNKYLSVSNPYMDARKRYKELCDARRKLEKNKAGYPNGKIHIVKNKNTTQYYIRTDSDDKSGVYISKKNHEIIKQYVQKKYEEEVIKLLDMEISALEKLLKKADSNIQKIQDAYSKNSKEVKQYIIPIDITTEDYISEWLAVPYVGKEINDNLPFYMSENGERVRSKSELNIANMLYKKGIPYKYECPLNLKNGLIIYPDFTILDAKRRCNVYWEHRGMMDDRGYSNHAVARIKDYVRNGVFLGDKLIITEETAISPLGTNEIEDIINFYFK